MRKLVYLIILLCSVAVLNSCRTTQNNPQDSTDNQSDISSPEQSADLEDVADIEDGDISDQQASTPMPETALGSELVSRITAKLEGALVFTPEQSTQAKKIIEDAFIGTGRSLTASYPANETKTITSEVVNRGKNQLMAILDGDQIDRFNKFLNR